MYMLMVLTYSSVHSPGIGIHSSTVSFPLGRIYHLQILLQIQSNIKIGFRIPPGAITTGEAEAVQHEKFVQHFHT